jgi:acyl-CoA thioesterase
MPIGSRPKEPLMTDLHEFFKKDRFAASVGIELLEIGKSRARAKLDIRPDHFNAVNIVHGAAIFSLADLVFAVAANAHGNVAVAVNANISYLKAAGTGTRTLFAEATEVSRNFKLASYTVRITDDRDELVAIFQGMVYRKRDKLMSTQPPPAPG